jgi:hypothetical protein
MTSVRSGRGVAGVALLLASAILAGGAAASLGSCGPFSDVAADSFCPFVLEVFFVGVTTGTTATTYDPTTAVSRLQMAAFLSRSVDGVLKRGSRRAAMKQFWTSQNAQVLGLTTVGTLPVAAEFDGLDVWVSNRSDGSVSRVRSSDGSVVGTWTGGIQTYGLLVAMGRIFVTSQNSPGALYRINPSLAPGALTTVATNLGSNASGIAFDGARVWTVNDNSVSIVTPGATLPWTVTTVTTGFGLTMTGALFDGANVWVTDLSGGKLDKLDANGAILQTVTVQSSPGQPVFDGTNIWVPNVGSNSVSVVRASSGAILTTLFGNGLDGPLTAVFDGQRVLITNNNVSGSSVSLWKAADLTTLGTFSVGASKGPWGACSDGSSFWIVLHTPGQLARF